MESQFRRDRSSILGIERVPVPWGVLGLSTRLQEKVGEQFCMALTTGLEELACSKTMARNLPQQRQTSEDADQNCGTTIPLTSLETIHRPVSEWPSFLSKPARGCKLLYLPSGPPSMPCHSCLLLVKVIAHIAWPTIRTNGCGDCRFSARCGPRGTAPTTLLALRAGSFHPGTCFEE